MDCGILCTVYRDNGTVLSFLDLNNCTGDYNRNVLLDAPSFSNFSFSEDR